MAGSPAGNGRLAVVISFQIGSGRYDADAEMFRFNASDGEGRLTCGIERRAFEGITRSRVRQSIANQQFADWERLILKLTEQKYVQSGATDSRALIVEDEDVREFWFA
jgi:hypothetical protein